MRVQVVSLAHRHLATVSAMHQAYLSTLFTGLTGRRLLAEYYGAVLDGRGACGFVAEEQGHAIGYVCGVWDSAALRRDMLRNHMLPLTGWGLLHILRRPHLLRSFLQRMCGKTDGPASAGSYELRPIVVIPEARGSEAARRLVERLAEHASAHGYREIHLFTEADNMRARKFYGKVGFHQADTLLRDDMSYICYVMPIPGSEA